jgi:hypothetical protein
MSDKEISDGGRQKEIYYAAWAVCRKKHCIFGTQR